jgi:hypothetical protein
MTSEEGQTERRMMSELVRLQQAQGYTFYVEGVLETDPEAIVSAMWDRILNNHYGDSRLDDWNTF